MIEFTVESEENGRMLEWVVFRRYPTLPRACLYRALRKRDVKIDGTRISRNTALRAGSTVTLYVSESVASYRIVYENEWILLVEKPQGLLSEPDGNGNGTEPSLLEAVNADRAARHDGAEPVALCHRLDRNTGGLLFLCKQAAFTAPVSEALSARYYRKRYRALVLGDARDILPDGAQDRTFRAYHFKDSRLKQVYVYAQERRGTKPIETVLRWIRYDASRDLSEIEAELVTGRTHQIRAHLAFLGHPVAGDGKYGIEARNRRLEYRKQALWAYCYEPSDLYRGPARLNGIPIEQILPRRRFTSVPDFR